MIEMIKERVFNNLRLRIFENRSAMGADAANAVSGKINDLLARQEFVNIIFAAAPSQNEFLFSLSQRQDVSWNRVNAFQMDEYVGLEKRSPRLFANFLKEKLFDKVPFHAIFNLDGSASDVGAECQRYAKLLSQYSPDITCLGIGVNAHIAFNDPHVADFNDPLRVKTVDLDLICRQQQVEDGCFDEIDDVPTHAITLSVPALLQANYIYCIVPGSIKAQAVYHTLYSEINEQYPSTILRRHPNTVIYLDMESSCRIKI